MTAVLLLLVAEFILQNLIIIRRFEVGKFRALGPAGILVAPAMWAERGVFFERGMAVGTERHEVRGRGFAPLRCEVLDERKIVK